MPSIIFNSSPSPSPKKPTVPPRFGFLGNSFFSRTLLNQPNITQPVSAPLNMVVDHSTAHDALSAGTTLTARHSKLLGGAQAGLSMLLQNTQFKGLFSAGNTLVAKLSNGIGSLQAGLMMKLQNVILDGWANAGYSANLKDSHIHGSLTAGVKAQLDASTLQKKLSAGHFVGLVNRSEAGNVEIGSKSQPIKSKAKSHLMLGPVLALKDHSKIQGDVTFLNPDKPGIVFQEKGSHIHGKIHNGEIIPFVPKGEMLKDGLIYRPTGETLAEIPEGSQEWFVTVPR